MNPKVILTILYNVAVDIWILVRAKKWRNFALPTGFEPVLPP